LGAFQGLPERVLIVADLNIAVIDQPALRAFRASWHGGFLCCHGNRFFIPVVVNFEQLHLTKRRRLGPWSSPMSYLNHLLEQIGRTRRFADPMTNDADRQRSKDVAAEYQRQPDEIKENPAIPRSEALT